MSRRPAASTLSLIAVATLTAGSLVQATAWRWLYVAALGVVFAIAAARRERGPLVLSGTAAIVVGATTGILSSILAAAAAAGLAMRFVPWLRPWFRQWLRKGTMDTVTATVAAVTTIVASIALAIWAAAQPRFSEGATVTLGEQSTLDRVIDQAQQIPAWIFPVAAIAFALVNAAGEEFVYRGVVLEAMRPFGPNAAIALQALAFGAAHIHGFPGGWWGVAMTTMYGAGLGWLRVRTRGMLAPFAVHVAADLVIAFLVRFGYA